MRQPEKEDRDGDKQKMKEKVEMGRKQRKRWRQMENKKNDGPTSRNFGSILQMVICLRSEPR